MIPGGSWGSFSTTGVRTRKSAAETKLSRTTTTRTTKLSRTNKRLTAEQHHFLKNRTTPTYGAVSSFFWIALKQLNRIDAPTDQTDDGDADLQNKKKNIYKINKKSPFSDYYFRSLRLCFSPRAPPPFSCFRFFLRCGDGLWCGEKRKRREERKGRKEREEPCFLLLVLLVLSSAFFVLLAIFFHVLFFLFPFFRSFSSSRISTPTIESSLISRMRDRARDNGKDCKDVENAVFRVRPSKKRPEFFLSFFLSKK